MRAFTKFLLTGMVTVTAFIVITYPFSFPYDITALVLLAGVSYYTWQYYLTPSDRIFNRAFLCYGLFLVVWSMNGASAVVYWVGVAGTAVAILCLLLPLIFQHINRKLSRRIAIGELWVSFLKDAEQCKTDKDVEQLQAKYDEKLNELENNT